MKSRNSHSRKRKLFNDSLNVVGKKIEYYRDLKNMSRLELSNKLMLLGLDIHEHSIYNIEKGYRTIVDYELYAIAKVLDIDISDLFSKEFRNKFDNV